jgi:hypothetical protein
MYTYADALCRCCVFMLPARTFTLSIPLYICSSPLRWVTSVDTARPVGGISCARLSAGLLGGYVPPLCLLLCAAAPARACSGRVRALCGWIWSVSGRHRTVGAAITHRATTHCASTTRLPRADVLSFSPLFTAALFHSAATFGLLPASAAFPSSAIFPPSPRGAYAMCCRADSVIRRKAGRTGTGRTTTRLAKHWWACLASGAGTWRPGRWTRGGTLYAGTPRQNRLVFRHRRTGWWAGTVESLCCCS